MSPKERHLAGPRAPTDLYHIGEGVAFVRRRPDSLVCCAATLPPEVYARLQGGEERPGFADIEAMRVYPCGKGALAALAAAREEP